MTGKAKKRHDTVVRISNETKAALDKHQKVSGSKSVNDAIANLLGIDTSKPKAKKIRRIYKEHTGVTPAIIDAAILRCWEHEAVRWQEQKTYFRGSLAEASSIDKSRAEINNAVREAMERTYSNGTTWMSLYPIWYKESLEDYINDRLQSLKAKGFIDNSTKGVWTMVSNVIESEEWDLLRLVTEQILPLFFGSRLFYYKQLNIPDLLRPRE